MPETGFLTTMLANFAMRGCRARCGLPASHPNAKPECGVRTPRWLRLRFNGVPMTPPADSSDWQWCGDINGRDFIFDLRQPNYALGCWPKQYVVGGQNGNAAKGFGTWPVSDSYDGDLYEWRDDFGGSTVVVEIGQSSLDVADGFWIYAYILRAKTTDPQGLADSLERLFLFRGHVATLCTSGGAGNSTSGWTTEPKTVDMPDDRDGAPAGGWRDLTNGEGSATLTECGPTERRLSNGDCVCDGVDTATVCPSLLATRYVYDGTTLWGAGPGGEAVEKFVFFEYDLPPEGDPGDRPAFVDPAFSEFWRLGGLYKRREACCDVLGDYTGPALRPVPPPPDPPPDPPPPAPAVLTAFAANTLGTVSVRLYSTKADGTVEVDETFDVPLTVQDPYLGSGGYFKPYFFVDTTTTGRFRITIKFEGSGSTASALAWTMVVNEIVDGVGMRTALQATLTFVLGASSVLGTYTRVSGAWVGTGTSLFKVS